MNILWQQLQKLRLPRLSANTKNSCAFLMDSVNKVSAFTHIVFPNQLSINTDAFYIKIRRTTHQERGCSYIQTPFYVL